MTQLEFEIKQSMMSDEELTTFTKEEISKLASTGGKSHIYNVLMRDVGG